MAQSVDVSKYEINEDSFRFVNSGKRITDTQLKTKGSSFGKDAFRRFCKNKASIAGAIVLGILLLLSAIVPMVSPFSVEPGAGNISEHFLQPKLFEAGTGFWDGTKEYKKSVNRDGSISGVVYDFENECPAGFYKPAVSKLVVDSEPTYINKATPTGKGGYMTFQTDNNDSQDNAVLYNYYQFPVTADGEYTFAYTMHTQDGVNEGSLGKFCVYLLDEETSEKIVLQDWTTSYNNASFDLSAKLTENGFTALNACRIYFEVEKVPNQSKYILLENLTLSCADETANANLAAISFTDATEMVNRAKVGTEIPAGYWQSNGVKGVYNSKIYYCEFVFDTYEEVYGRSEEVYAISDFRKLKEQGLCDFDEKNIIETFTVLSDECPIKEVLDVTKNHKTGKVQSVKVNVPKYYKMGYDKMPRHILGTDENGYDLFTLMFTSLRTSLLLGLCTAAFCFCFGLVWGSISGYFGGGVDLAMERFCEILGGVPWLVVMTLAILHFGSNFLTFVMALCLTGWMGTAARTRTQFYRFKGSEYVLASRTLGARDMRLIFRHILPNSLGTIVTSSVLMIVSTIYSEATLAYLNLGLQGTQAFGVMMAANQQYIQSYSFLVVFPAVVMALLMISFNLFGNGLRDALNPTLRGAED
ncbi:MAG: ABC transporter permease [Clostridia bacterium]|nr:ABC transporter permease [Clostridia bacterium]